MLFMYCWLPILSIGIILLVLWGEVRGHNIDIYTLFLGEVNPNPNPSTQLGTNGVSMLWQWPWTIQKHSHTYIRYIEGIPSHSNAVNRHMESLSLRSTSPPCVGLVPLSGYKSHHHDKVKARIHFILTPDPLHTYCLKAFNHGCGWQS